RDRAEREAAATHHRTVEGRDDRAGAGCRGDRHAQLPLLARLGHLVEPLERTLGLADLRGLLLRAGDRARDDVLVAVARLLPGVAHALVDPLLLRLDAGPQGLGPLGVLLVGLTCTGPGELTLGEEGLVAAVVHRDLLLGQVELDDPGHAACEQLAVVAHDHHGHARAGDE